LGMVSFCEQVFVTHAKFSLSVTHFCIETIFLLMVSFCAHQFISQAFLPRDFLFLGWFLFVSRYLSPTQNSVCQSRISALEPFFCWWFPFVRISLSVTHFCIGTIFCRWFLFVSRYLSLARNSVCQSHISAQEPFFADGFLLCASVYQSRISA